MPKKLFILLLILKSSFLSAFSLSESAEISLITCSPGVASHTLFGHSAIRVNDPANDFDMVFNYGTFDFQQPNFMLNFIKGRLNYFLSVSSFESFVSVYRRNNRSVFEHVLLLDSTQKQTVFNFLVKNYKPENRFYLYDFFFDNCSSRIRDVFQAALADSLKLSHGYAREEESFRDLIDPYIEKRRWIDVGIYMMLGAPSDQIADPEQYMFLPDYLDSAFANGEIFINGEWKAFSKEDNVYYLAQPETYDFLPYPVSHPVHLMWIFFLFILIFSIYGLIKSKKQIGLDFLIFFFFGFLGVLFLFFWVGTDHTVLPWNFNLLWAPPSHLIAAILLVFIPYRKWVSYYFAITAITIAVLILLWKFWPQEFHEIMIPFSAIIFLRSAYRVLQSQKSATSTYNS